MIMMGGKRKSEGGGGDTDAPTSKASKSSGVGGLGLECDDGVLAPGAQDKNGNCDADARGGDDENGVAGGNAEGEVDAGGKLHPLLNEVVLRNLFKYFAKDLELLGDIRLVCRTWRDASLPIWRAVATPTIVFSRSRQRYYLMDTNNGKTSLSRFLDLLEDQAQGRQAVCPYRQFHLQGWTLLDVNPNPNSATRFWEVVGRHLTKLTLENCKSAKSEDFLRIINQSCPSLEVLILDTSHFSDRDLWKAKSEDGDAEYEDPAHGEHPNLKSLHLLYDDRHLSSSLRVPYLELLSHFPNLTFVKIDSKGLHREMTKFLRAVKKIRTQDPRKLPITMLSTIDPVSFKFEPVGAPLDNGEGEPQRHRRVDEMMSLLQELGISLDSVSLDADLKPDEIRNIMEVSGLTLEKVSAWSPRCSFPFGVELPNLKELFMAEGFCDNMEFIKYSPHLKKLYIWDDSRGLPEILRRANPLATTLVASAPKPQLANTQLMELTSLELEDNTVTEEDLKWMVKWMPRVSNLTMFLNDKQFTIVCENWQQLVQLTVMGSELTDEGVIGMGLDPGTGTQSGTVELDGGTKPNVTYLKNLVVFKAPKSTLTDVSLFHGLLKMRNLRRIFFQNWDGIGAEAKEAVEQLGIRISEFSSVCQAAN